LTADGAFIVAVVDRLIASRGEIPGGGETGVSEFINRQMELPHGYRTYWYLNGPFTDSAPETLGYQLPYSTRDSCRNGICEVNAGCSKTYVTLQR
jgi:gluconate 2-dehydrogenase gamma chain